MGKPDVDILLLDGETEISGKILFYEKEPFLLYVGEGEDIPKYHILLTAVGMIIVKNYDFGNDLYRKKLLESLKEGHVVHAPKDKKFIYDFCTGIVKKIDLNNKIQPYNGNLKHDIELRNVLRRIK